MNGKIDPRIVYSARQRKEIKANTARRARRDAKRRPDDAPARRTKGWA